VAPSGRHNYDTDDVLVESPSPTTEAGKGADASCMVVVGVGAPTSVALLLVVFTVITAITSDDNGALLLI
jgi:hypothetical protein